MSTREDLLRQIAEAEAVLKEKAKEGDQKGITARKRREEQRQLELAQKETLAQEAKVQRTIQARAAAKEKESENKKRLVQNKKVKAAFAEGKKQVESNVEEHAQRFEGAVKEKDAAAKQRIRVEQQKVLMAADKEAKRREAKLASAAVAKREQEEMAAIQVERAAAESAAARTVQVRKAQEAKARELEQVKMKNKEERRLHEEEIAQVQDTQAAIVQRNKELIAEQEEAARKRLARQQTETDKKIAQDAARRDKAKRAADRRKRDMEYEEEERIARAALQAQASAQAQVRAVRAKEAAAQKRKVTSNRKKAASHENRLQEQEMGAQCYIAWFGSPILTLVHIRPDKKASSTIPRSPSEKETQPAASSMVSHLATAMLFVTELLPKGAGSTEQIEW